jgi:hypothetical protein
MGDGVVVAMAGIGDDVIVGAGVFVGDETGSAEQLAIRTSDKINIRWYFITSPQSRVTLRKIDHSLDGKDQLSRCQVAALDSLVIFTNSRRRIFPTVDLGRLSQISTNFGTLYPASLLRQYARSSGALTC